ncbi:MAG TPA: hypothetical protein VFH83_13825 [Spirochaetia bacterium]|nr:hypothetical protein [Spirochaetia bacterium]
MGAVSLLTRFARLSRRRGTKLRDPRAADMMMYSWLVIVIFGRFAYNCFLAAQQLALGHQEFGDAITRFSLAHFLLLSFLVPFLASFRSSDGLNRRRLALAAVPARPLVVSELLTMASSPLNWAIALFAIPPVFPLLRLGHPVTSIIALVLGLVAAILLARAAASALALSSALQRLGGLLRYAFAAGLLVLVAANFDFQWKGGSIEALVFGKHLLLADPTGAGLLAGLDRWSPSMWIYGGAPAACLGAVVLALALYLLSELAAYRKVGRGNAAQAGPVLGGRLRLRPRGNGAPRARAPGGSVRSVLLRQELRSLRSLPTSALALLFGLACAVWLLAAREASVNIALLGTVLATAVGFSYPSNVFGRDGQALRRYALAAPDWGEVFLAKNAAWLAVCGLAFLPPLLADLLRVGPASALSLLLVCCVVLILCVLWGNLSSMLFPVLHASARPGEPAPRAIFVNQIAPFAFWAVALGIDRSAGRFGSAGFDAAFAALLAVGLVAYRVLLRRIALQFDRDVEGVLERFRSG